MTDTLLDGKRLGFIGAGNMAEAIAKGLLDAGAVDAGQIIASDVDDGRRQLMADRYGITITADNHRVVRAADIVILAIKPQVVATVLGDIGPAAGPDKLVLSIVAGLTVATMAPFFPNGARLIRTIPNTPVLVQEGMVAIAVGETATPEDYQMAEAIFSPVAKTVRLEEKLMDAALGVSGSGPAYVFMMIDALADGGVKMGLPRPIALTLAAQTLLGGAKMCLESGRHPGELKDMVTSPAGTTIAALHTLETMGLRGALISAVEAAAMRSEALGRLGPIGGTVKPGGKK
jgi:pyrroline-5-carboxylate reductase